MYHGALGFMVLNFRTGSSKLENDQEDFTVVWSYQKIVNALGSPPSSFFPFASRRPYNLNAFLDQSERLIWDWFQWEITIPTVSCIVVRKLNETKTGGDPEENCSEDKKRRRRNLN